MFEEQNLERNSKFLYKNIRIRSLYSWSHQHSLSVLFPMRLTHTLICRLCARIQTVVCAHKRVHMSVSRAVHSSVNGTTAIPWRSSRRRLTLLEQLRGCQEAWCPGAPWDREEAHAAIRGTPAGVSFPPSSLLKSINQGNLTFFCDVRSSLLYDSDLFYLSGEFREVNQSLVHRFKETV